MNLRIVGLFLLALRIATPLTLVATSSCIQPPPAPVVAERGEVTADFGDHGTRHNIKVRARFSGMNSGFTDFKVANDNTYDLTNVRINIFGNTGTIKLEKPLNIPAGDFVAIPVSDLLGPNGETYIAVNYDAAEWPIQIKSDQGEWSGSQWSPNFE